jgi:hypothetical protein
MSLVPRVLLQGAEEFVYGPPTWPRGSERDPTELFDFADEEGYDLVVLETWGRTGLSQAHGQWPNGSSVMQRAREQGSVTDGD